MKRVLLLAILAALAAPAVASAHASLDAATPDYRQRIETSPERLVLRFSQAIEPIPNGIVVRDADGQIVSHPAGISRDRRTLSATLLPLTRGAYAVRWRTLSVSDGHIVSGLYTFGVGVDAPPPTEALGASGPSTTEDIVRWIAYLGLAVLAGGLAFRLLALPRELPEPLDQRFFALIGAATIVTIDAGVLALFLRADAALQLPFAEFLYADLAPFVDGTRFGSAWVWMTLGSALVGGLLTLAWLRRTHAPLWAALTIVLTLGAGFSVSGHSASEPNSSTLSIVADWIHITAASVWVGGLVTLALIGWRLERTSRHRAFLRFSRIATVLVGVVVSAGVYLGLLRLGTPSDLWSTVYGQVLLAKIALVTLALAWGAAHHFVVRPRLERGAEPAGGRVGRSLIGESLVGVGVLLLAALLVNTAPPERSPERSRSNPSTATQASP